MIDFEPTEEQRLLREAVAELARGEVRRRARESEGARGLPADLRRKMHAMGLHLGGLPEALGGQGLGMLAQVMVEEELGYGDPGAAYAAPGPGAFGRALCELGTPEQQRRYLEVFSAESEEAAELSGAVAWSEPAPSRERPGFVTEARREDGGFSLFGTKSFVLNADTADRYVVFAQLDASRGWDGIGAFVLRRDWGVRPGARHATLGLDAASFGELIFEGARVADEDRLEGGGDLTRALLRFFFKQGLVVAARAVGLSQAAFDVARDYCDSRKAFGKPIGHFQAVAFKLADRLMDAESARWMVWRAAWAWDSGQPEADCLRLSAQAIAQALEGAMRCGDDAVQLHGGAGFIRDYPAEKMMRDAKQMALTCPTAELCDQLASALSVGARLAPELVLPTPDAQPIFTLPQGNAMTIEFSLTRRQHMLREAIEGLGKAVIRPQSLSWDRAGEVDREFLGRFVEMARGVTGGGEAAAEFAEGDKRSAARDPSRPSEVNRTSLVGAEAMAWCDAGLLLSMPGPGLGAPPVRASGTPEQKERFFSIFRGMPEKGLYWGAYGLTEPGAGSDVAGIRTSCHKEGSHWVLNGRKCYITNGGKASWTVIFATIDPALGRAGHRAFVVEKGTPGFSVGRIEEKMGLRASETAELVLEDCRVPAENLLGGEEKYVSKEGFMTAMKTFDNTRPLVAAMACGIGRAAYEYARDFVKENYLLSRPLPRYAALAERLAKIERRLEAARMLCYRAAWLADHHQPNAKEASMSKAAAGEAALWACVEAIEICGAHGSLSSDHALLEKWFRDIKVYDIFEGTGQIQRVVIAKRIMTHLHGFLAGRARC